MNIGTSSRALFLGFFYCCAACSSDNEPGPGAGGSGVGGAARAGSSAGGSAAGGSAGAGGSSGNAGSSGRPNTGGNATAGTSAQGGASAAGAGGTGGAGTTGGTGGTNAQGGGPASTDGLPFVGSCLASDHCTDEWDDMFGAATLEQFCVGQQGTWSTGHCATAAWKKKCTQAVFSGVYVQYLPEDGICVLGFEEPL